MPALSGRGIHIDLSFFECCERLATAKRDVTCALRRSELASGVQIGRARWRSADATAPHSTVVQCALTYRWSPERTGNFAVASSEQRDLLITRGSPVSCRGADSRRRSGPGNTRKCFEMQLLA